MPKCEVCSTVESKYKCPKCSTRYCSLECFKAHKNDSGDCGQSSRDPKTEQPSKFELLKSDPDLSTMLQKDTFLQSYLKAIESSNNPKELFQQLESNERFIIFKEKVLSIIGKAA